MKTRISPVPKIFSVGSERAIYISIIKTTLSSWKCSLSHDESSNFLRRAQFKTFLRLRTTFLERRTCLFFKEELVLFSFLNLK